MTRKFAQDDGFALIITVVLLSAVLGLMIVSVSSIAHASRTAVLEEVFKAESAWSTESCAKLVLLRLANARNFSGNTEWAIGEHLCKVSEVIVNGNQVVNFTVGVEIEKVASEYKVDARLDPFQIINIIQTY